MEELSSFTYEPSLATTEKVKHEQLMYQTVLVRIVVLQPGNDLEVMFINIYMCVCYNNPIFYGYYNFFKKIYSLHL